MAKTVLARILTCSLLFGLLVITRNLSAQTCAPGATTAAARRALGIQAKLLAARSPEMGTDVPVAIKAPLHDFKQALILTVETALRCNNPAPDQVQHGLAQLLQANQPEKRFVSQPDHEGPDQPDIGDYGDALKIEVKPMPKYGDLFSIDLSYSVACGEDNILLLYRHTAQGWHRELIYGNPDLNSVGDAIGDFFKWALVPGPHGTQLFAAVHGTPWCSSRESEFAVDLIAFPDAHHPQRTLAHREEGYSRFEHEPDLTSTPDGVQLRVWSDSLDFDSLFIRPRIWRFRTTTGQLERIQPIADNVRDFVDTWLQLPWAEAARWTDAAPDALHSFRDRFDYAKHPNGSTPSLSFGPVRACGSDRFQVELDLTDGPKFDHESTVYALVHRSPTAFTMLAASPRPDPTCTGPDIMKRAKK